MNDNNLPITKFYKLNQIEKRDQRVESIREKIFQQEEHIAELLSKYKTLIPNQADQKPTQLIGFRKKYKNNQTSHKQQTVFIYKNSQPIQKNKLKLPTLNSQKFNKSKITNKTSRKTIQVYHGSLQVSRNNDKRSNKYNKQDLSYIYGGYNHFSPLNRSLSKRKKRKSIQMNNENKNKLKEIEIETNSEQKINKQQQINNIPKPIAYYRPTNIQIKPQDSSSQEEGDIPMTYYSRQMKQKLQQQSNQEINFLYFSKNQTMKNWTEEILQMFDKHNNELEAYHKKTKYLQVFDQAFFGSDVYR